MMTPSNPHLPASDEIEEEPIDKVNAWRFGQLLRAGASPRAAEILAAERGVDLHQACAVVALAGSSLALRILT